MANQGVSIVIGTYNRKKFLKLTIESVRQEMAGLSLPYELIVIDGGSTDGSLAWLTKQKDIITIVQHNRGAWKGRKLRRRSWGYFMNLGFKAAQGKYICMLSDDCLLVPGAIKNGVGLFDQRLASGEQLGAVAFYWRNWPEQEKYWVGITLGNRYFVNHGLYLRSAVEEVGYIDEESYAFYHADSDLAQRLWSNGYTCVPSPDSFVEHFSHANTSLRKENKQQERLDRKTYENRWKSLGDPLKDWQELVYSDPHRTALKFKKCNFF